MFISIGIVSVHLTNNQASMLKEQSKVQYQNIAFSLSRDIARLQGRNLTQPELSAIANDLMNDYARYYSDQDIHIELINLWKQDINLPETRLSFTNHGHEHFIYISGTLPGHFEHYYLTYQVNVSESIANMQAVQNTLLISAAASSIIAALALYFILTTLFRPLQNVAEVSKKIASGQFGERIPIKGKGELTQVAIDFNKMADTVEEQMTSLQEEAISRQRFADNFAHEIRTPLTSIYGYGQYLQRAKLDEKEIAEASGHIISEAQHMEKVSSSLLELATLRNYTPIKDFIVVSDLFEDVSQAMKGSLDKCQIRLICHSEVEALEGQRDLLKSMLVNLCNNALKACSPEKGIIHLNAKQLPKATLISVTDNGRGIPKSDLAKVTEPFYQVDGSRERKGGNLGLGLALCSQIAKVHGAELSVQSKINTGTTIHVLFTDS
ncbi:MAG: HAMP domain-containing histidine kinase [Coriobacteriia bacterium]|nr:HAMP domain-containing histidine kinase [Coriobacteriia bacterium]